MKSILDGSLLCQPSILACKRDALSSATNNYVIIYTTFMASIMPMGEHATSPVPLISIAGQPEKYLAAEKIPCSSAATVTANSSSRAHSSQL